MVTTKRAGRVLLKGAVFDWDGTLVDINEREFYCINNTLSIHHAPPIDQGFYIQNYYRRPFEVGTGPRMVLEAALGEKRVEEEGVYDTYRRFFTETVNKAKLQTGALDLLRLLKDHDVKVGIATMRFTRSTVDKELELLGVDSLADLLLTREDLGFKRALGSLEETVEQRASLVSKTLDTLRVNTKDAFLVGDSWWDIRAGKKLGLKTALVLTGFSEHNDFTSEKPDLTVHSLSELSVQFEKNGGLGP